MISDYITRAAEIWGVPRKHLMGMPRYGAVAEARMAVYAVAYETGLYSLPQIGRVLGRDHTTVLHGVRKMRYERRPDVLARVQALRDSSGPVGKITACGETLISGQSSKPNNGVGDIHGPD